RLGDIESERPWVAATTVDGEELRIEARYVVGSDGSRGPCRAMIPDTTRQRYFHEYPFAWFGILCEAPPSHEVLVYSRAERGFALWSASLSVLTALADPAGRCSPSPSGGGTSTGTSLPGSASSARPRSATRCSSSPAPSAASRCSPSAATASSACSFSLPRAP